MKNSVLANKNRLFIMRLTESQLPLCDCQREGQAETDKERVRERKDAFSLLIKVFFPVWQGRRDMVAETVLGTWFAIVLLIHTFGIIQTVNSINLAAKCQQQI